MAKQWCAVGLSNSLTQSGGENVAIIHRKMMMCDIELQNWEGALTQFETMQDTEQNNMLSRYLLFRIAVQTWNQHLASESIRGIAQHEDKDEVRNLLYACIKEAQYAGDKFCTLAALKALLHTWEQEATVPASLPSVARCIIRLLFLIASHSEAEEDTSIYKDISDTFTQGERGSEIVEQYTNTISRCVRGAQRDR